MNRNQSLLKMAAAVFLFGTIGIFRRWIPISSPMLAFVRGSVGACFLMILQLIGSRKKRQDTNKKEQPSCLPLWKKLLWFGVPGIFIGLNWVLLFEAYRFTTVAVATLCYYMAPTFVILLSPIFLKEKLTVRQLVLAAIALVGMVLVSGVTSGESVQLTGVLFGLGAATFYAGQILCNKKAPVIDVYERTVIELLFAALCLLPYLLLNGEFTSAEISMKTAGLLLFVGIVHTGITYALYFDGMQGLKAQTVALLSYLDPVVALMLSWLGLDERLLWTAILGAVLILGSAATGEIPLQKKKT